MHSLHDVFVHKNKIVEGCKEHASLTLAQSSLQSLLLVSSIYLRTAPKFKKILYVTKNSQYVFKIISKANS